MNNREQTRKMAKGRMMGYCNDFNGKYPGNLIIKWKEEIVNPKATGCFPQAVEDSANRTLYFRREYVTMYMSYALRAAELSGICEGLLFNPFGDSDTSTHTGSFISQGRTSIELAFQEMTDKFDEVEAKMYEMSDTRALDKEEKPWWNWATILKEKYPCVTESIGDPDCVLRALKSDFYPDFKYATVGFKGDMNGKLHLMGMHREDLKSKDYGSFFIEVEDSQGMVFVFFRNPRDRTALTPSLESMLVKKKGKTCGTDTEFCKEIVVDQGFCQRLYSHHWYYHCTNTKKDCNTYGKTDECKEYDCKNECYNAVWKFAQNVNRYMDETAWNEYVKRGAIILPPVEQADIPQDNDDIIEKFDSEEGPYSVIGISGEWPGLQEVVFTRCDTTADCAEGLCCHVDKFCTSDLTDSCMENRWDDPPVDSGKSIVKKKFYEETPQDGSGLKSKIQELLM